MIEKIASHENLMKACSHLLEKNDSCGIDGMRLSQLKEYLEINEETLQAAILNGTYTPGLVQETDIISAKGKVRTIAILNAIDRLVLRAIHQVIYPHLSPVFSESSHAYQEGKGVATAVRQAAQYIQEGYRYSVDIDIENYFDNIPHKAVCTVLEKHGVDETTVRLISSFLNCNVVRDFEIKAKEKGLAQGSPLSPLLSNLYLHEVDVYFESNGWRFCRFADDIRLFSENYQVGVEIFQNVKTFLEDNCGLKVNVQKSGVFPALARIYLGYQFVPLPDGRIESKKQTRDVRAQLFRWKASALEKVGEDYHIIADGVLTKKDYSILFENEEKKMILPVAGTESLSLYSDISFGCNFFQFISTQGIKVNFFDKHGEYLGAFVPKRLSASASLGLEQGLVYKDPQERLALAKRFALAAAHNIRENLRYYTRHSASSLLRKTIGKISELMDEEEQADEWQQLLLLEARIRESYYECFNDILPADDFTFTKRSRQPPLDPINSLISFGNTLLYRHVAKEIYKSRLDIRIGFLHSTTRRYESLNLDVSEVFRPVIVERVIFSLVNRHHLNDRLHFDVKESGAVWLNQEGKKIFLTAFQGKLMQTIKENGVPKSYASLIRTEIQKLCRYFEYGEEYQPYKYHL